MTQTNIGTSVPVYPGTALKNGSSGSDVRFMQQQLNKLGTVYKGINKVSEDGRFGNETRNAVIRFQKQFSLNPDGIIGRLTWNSILAVSGSIDIAEAVGVTTNYIGVLQNGSANDHVRFLQSYLNQVKTRKGYTWPTLTVDGRFGRNTALAVAGFQSAYNLAVDGKAGRATWTKLLPEFNSAIRP